MYLRKLRKKIAMTMAAGCVAGSVFAPAGMPVAEAGVEQILGTVVGMAQVYDAYFSAFIDATSSIASQNEAFIGMVQQYGNPSEDEQYTALVDSVMEQLLDQGKYSEDARALPFRWWVFETNADPNAFCTANNSVFVLSSLLNCIHGDRDMLAGVLAHEMTHGINHHVIQSAAKNAAEKYGINWLYNNYGKGNSDIKTLTQMLYRYEYAKNIILPNEYEADRDGFYIAASAGFNPGGAPALMAKFWGYFNNYGTHADFHDFFAPKPEDHPDSDKRLAALSEMLTEYSYNHVKVVDYVNVYVDDNLLFTAQPVDQYTAMEVAYLTAGGIAKDFHDNRLSAMWPFRHNADGSVSYEPSGDAKKWAKKAIREAGTAALLEDSVVKAYSADSKVGARDEIYAKELERLSGYKKRTERLSKLDDYYLKRKLENSNAYIAYNSPRQALHEVNLALANGNKLQPAQLSQAHAMKGYAFVEQNLINDAELELNTALSINPQNAVALIGRAGIYSDRGETEKALADCNLALQLRPDVADLYAMRARVYDQMGDEASALANCQKARQLNANVNIPEKYAAMLNPEG